jgi:hypothetical protein
MHKEFLNKSLGYKVRILVPQFREYEKEFVSGFIHGSGRFSFLSVEQKS